MRARPRPDGQLNLTACQNTLRKWVCALEDGHDGPHDDGNVRWSK